jgi:rubrerythrin
MKLEDAIKTAIEFETKVTTHYDEATKKTTDAVGKKVFETLAKEEQGHIAYLKSRLDEWKKTGHVTTATLETAIPSKAKIKEGTSKLKPKGDKREHTSEVQFLQRALDLEVETSSFYRRMVSELDAEGQRLFQRFVEIEEGHVAIVQAQIDAVTGLGFWFDMQEFQLEAE